MKNVHSLFLLQHAAKFVEIDPPRFVLVELGECIFDLLLGHVRTDFSEFCLAEVAVAVFIDGLEGQGHFCVFADEFFVAHGSVSVQVLLLEHIYKFRPIENKIKVST